LKREKLFGIRKKQENMRRWKAAHESFKAVFGNSIA
jgi:hypothetical protein